MAERLTASQRRPVVDTSTDAVTVTNVDTTDVEVNVALDDLTKAELVERAEAAGLDTAGTKAELVARLEESGA